MNIKLYFYQINQSGIGDKKQEFDFLSVDLQEYFLRQRGIENAKKSLIEYIFSGDELIVLSGVEKKIDANDLQNHGAKTMKLIKKIVKDRKIERVKIELCFVGDIFLSSQEGCSGINIRFFLEKGLLMGRQNDDYFKQNFSKLVICDDDIIGIKNTELFSIVRGIEIARDLTYKPANIINPDTLQVSCETELSKRGIKIKVYNQADLEQENMNLFLAVGRASSFPPRMLVLEYTPDGKNISTEDEVFTFVGKGVTYDSGGLYLKPYPHMNEMHGDMGGAATVIGIMSALQDLNIQKKVVGVIGLVENMPDSNAYKNGEIITSKSGKTVYISHSDAEGRLVLADMMTFIEENYNTSAIVSIATLTEAVMRALGEMYTGVIGNNKKLLEQIKKCGQNTNEWVWELPLDKILLDSLKHPLADVDNIGKYDTLCGVQAGAGFVAQFLKDTSKWVHCDIAGSCLRDKMRQDYDLDKGLGTGAMVHLFLELIKGE